LVTSAFPCVQSRSLDGPTTPFSRTQKGNAIHFLPEKMSEP
jgi:hypothetical protein